MFLFLCLLKRKGEIRKNKNRKKIKKKKKKTHRGGSCDSLEWRPLWLL